MLSIESIEEKLKAIVFTTEQYNNAIKELKNNQNKIKSILSMFIYNRDWGREVTLVTTPDIGLKFKFEKE